MIFRYWMPKEKATVINNVDRLVFDSPGNVMVRACVSGIWEWRQLVFGKDFIQFTMASE